jgi:ferric-dicitrate binding protein FerR (iron transport regulator)
MSKAERSVFEIELSLDEELRDIFENYKMIWICYPKTELKLKENNFSKTLESKKSKKDTYIFLRSRKILGLAAALFILFGLGFYFRSSDNLTYYTNERFAKEGQRLRFFLPDSSSVILNSGSIIKYSSKFNEKREVWLDGEAFFKVTRSINSPFIVRTNDLDIKVLGTEFNVNSKAINKTVSLEKGKVNILVKSSNDEINLLPKEELVWNSKTKLVIKRNFDVNKVSAWKDNILILDDEKFEDAIIKINQFYGVNFIIKDPEIARQHIKGAFKDQNIDEFINSLEFISDVSIKKNTSKNFIIVKSYENK